MNKRIPFIALLVAMELGLSQITFGTIDIFTSTLALLTLRRKDFLIYLIASSPSVIITYLQYGAFWASNSNTMLFDLTKGTFFGLLHPWYFLGASTIFFGTLLFLTLRSFFTISSANKLRKKFNLRRVLYPEIPFKARVRKRDFGDKFTILIKVYAIALTGFLIFGYVYANAMIFQNEHLYKKYLNCYQLEYNYTDTNTVEYRALVSVLNC